MDMQRKSGQGTAPRDSPSQATCTMAKLSANNEVCSVGPVISGGLEAGLRLGITSTRIGEPTHFMGLTARIKMMWCLQAPRDGRTKPPTGSSATKQVRTHLGWSGFMRL